MDWDSERTNDLWFYGVLTAMLSSIVVGGLVTLAMRSPVPVVLAAGIALVIGLLAMWVAVIRELVAAIRRDDL